MDLSRENVETLCRLCLKSDDFVVNIYSGLEEKFEKDPLRKRIYELYGVEVKENDGFPKNICHQCLYLTESFSSFRENVKLCEKQLKTFLESKKTKKCQGVTIMKHEILDNRYEGLNGFHGFVPDESYEITVVDPNHESESSDDCFSMEDSETEMSLYNKKVVRTEKILDTSTKSENCALPAPTNFNDIINDIKNTFLCQYCDMAFTNEMKCDEHELRHDAANPFICSFCPFRTINRQDLIYHIKEAHDNERPFVCALCNKGFCRRSDLKKHTIVHTGVRPYSCPVCSKSFSRNTNLTKHLRIHSSVKPHVCQKCPRSFTTFADLSCHQRAHNEMKPHTCTKCSLSFSRKDKLQKHYLSHLRKESASFFSESHKHTSNNEAVFHNTIIEKCTTNVTISMDSQLYLKPINNVDNKSLPVQLQKIQTQGNLSEVKSNVREHVCHKCSKTFTRKREFQRHQALHLDFLYKCQQCGKNFNRRDKLLRHEKTHHIEQYNCKQCNMCYTKLEALQMHVKVHDLHNSLPKVEKNVPFNKFFPNETPMGLGFYSEIKPED